MTSAKALYHRLIPERIRNPFGFARRSFADSLRRAITRPPLPPRELLANIQLTPFLSEYLAIGKRSAKSIVGALALAGIARDARVRVLDFGCGSARTLRHLRDTEWEIHGCDVDREAIDWVSKAIPFARFQVNPSDPPLPYERETFDAVFAVSLFTHFTEAQQTIWATELARILKPRGVALVSTLGPSVIEAFPRIATPENRRILTEDGFVFVRGGEAFNSHGAFHTVNGIVRFFGSWFDLVAWMERGLDDFQDLTVLRKNA